MVWKRPDAEAASCPSLQYETHANLARMITTIAEIEGPIHVDLAIERIRLHYGLGKVRGNTRVKVVQAINRRSRQ